MFIAFSAISCAQNPAWQSQDIGIRKKNPRLYFNNNWIGTSGNTGTTLYFNGVAVGSDWAADTTDMLSKYAHKASPTFTGTVTIPTPFTLGATSVTSNGTELNVLDGIPGTLTSTELGYSDGVTSAIQTQLNAKLNVADTIPITGLVPMLNDTIPLVTFGIGSGATADTACFNNNRLIGAFYNEGSDTLVVTQLMGILAAGTGTETISVQISWHTTMLSGSATNLNTSALAITSHTTGTVDVSFPNAKIPPNVFVWGILSGASKDNKPTFLSVTLSGYKIPTY